MVSPPVRPLSGSPESVAAGLPPAICEIIDKHAAPVVALWLKEILSNLGLTDFELIYGLSAESVPRFPDHFKQFIGDSECSVQFHEVVVPLLELQLEATRLQLEKTRIREQIIKGAAKVTNNIPEPISNPPIYVQDMSHRLNSLVLSQSSSGRGLLQWTGNHKRAASQNDPPSSQEISLGDLSPWSNSQCSSFSNSQASNVTNLQSSGCPRGVASNKPANHYVRRAKFFQLDNVTGPADPDVEDLTRTKRLPAAILAKCFGGASNLLADCSGLSDSEFGELVDRAMSNRCRTQATRDRVCSFVQNFLEFALYRADALPFYGGAAIPTIVSWLDHVRLRGETVPHLARYCLLAFGEAIGVCFSIDHPAIRAASIMSKRKGAKSAAGAPWTLVEALERCAADQSRPDGMQLAAALFSLMIYASLRFAGIRDVSELWVSDSAVCGKSLDHKDKAGSITAWAAPRAGFSTNGAWFLPVLSFWNTMKSLQPEDNPKEFQFLFPYISKKVGNFVH